MTNLCSQDCTDTSNSGPLIVVEGEQLTEDVNGEGGILPPLSSTWTSSFDQEIESSHLLDIQRRGRSSPNLQVYTPSTSYTQDLSSGSSCPSSPASSRGSNLSRLGYHTPEPLPSPFLSPNERPAPGLPNTSYTPFDSPLMVVRALPSETANRSLPRTPVIQLSPLPASSELVPKSPGPPISGSFRYSPAPVVSPSYLHAPLPVHAYHSPRLHDAQVMSESRSRSRALSWTG